MVPSIAPEAVHSVPTAPATAPTKAMFAFRADTVPFVPADMKIAQTTEGTLAPPASQPSTRPARIPPKKISFTYENQVKHMHLPVSTSFDGAFVKEVLDLFAVNVDELDKNDEVYLQHNEEPIESSDTVRTLHLESGANIEVLICSSSVT